MLRAIGVPSLDALIDQTIPPGIRSPTPLDLPPADSEHGYLRRLRTDRGAATSSRGRTSAWATTTASRRA